MLALKENMINILFRDFLCDLCSVIFSTRAGRMGECLKVPYGAILKLLMQQLCSVGSFSTRSLPCMKINK